MAGQTDRLADVLVDRALVVGTDGRIQVDTGAAALASTGTQTSVPSAAADTVLLAANAARRGATIYNDSTAVLYVLLSNAASSNTNYTVQVAAGGYYEVPFGYTGVVKGIWAAANGNARVTEFA